MSKQEVKTSKTTCVVRPRKKKKIKKHNKKTTENNENPFLDVQG